MTARGYDAAGRLAWVAGGVGTIVEFRYGEAAGVAAPSGRATDFG